MLLSSLFILNSLHLNAVINMKRFKNFSNIHIHDSYCLVNKNESKLRYCHIESM